MDDRKRFEGQHVLITGAARGIGFEISRHFAMERAKLTLIDAHPENLQHAAKVLRELTEVQVYKADVSVKDEVEKAVNYAEKFAPVDVLINNAGIAMETPFLKITEDQWRKVLDVNLTGMFFVAQAVCGKMAERKRGVVVNMGSKNSLDGEFGYAHYNASKGGVVMLTKTMALELAHLNIRVNAVCPGYIQTPMSLEIDPPEFTSAFVERYIPLNRTGTVEDVAPAFLFLASNESRFITGQILVIDGGQLAGQKPGKGLTDKI